MIRKKEKRKKRESSKGAGCSEFGRGEEKRVYLTAGPFSEREPKAPEGSFRD
jgi:hypothetical protein